MIKKFKNKNDFTNRFGENKNTIISLLKSGASLELYPQLSNDKAVAMAALKANIYNYKFISDKLKKDKDVIMAGLRKDGVILSVLSEDYKDNENVVRIAYQTYEDVLKYASKRLRTNKKFMLDFIKDNIENFKYVMKPLKEDKEILYLVKPLIVNFKNSINFQEDYQNLLKYEREDELLEKLKDSNSSKSTKVKI